MPSFTESEIIEGCCAGDSACQEYLYNQNSTVFLKVCVRYAKDNYEAEQLLQDGFLKIFQKIKHFQKKGSFEGWMRRIMVNTCLDYFRTKSFKKAQNIDCVPDWQEFSVAVVNAEALDKVDLDYLVQIIQSLPTMSRTVFNLYVFDGFSHKEIAASLKISEGTSQWHVNNARKILQKKILANKNREQDKFRVYGR